MVYGLGATLPPLYLLEGMEALDCVGGISPASSLSVSCFSLLPLSLTQTLTPYLAEDSWGRPHPVKFGLWLFCTTHYWVGLSLEFKHEISASLFGHRLMALLINQLHW